MAASSLFRSLPNGAVPGSGGIAQAVPRMFQIVAWDGSKDSARPAQTMAGPWRPSRCSATARLAQPLTNAGSRARARRKAVGVA